MQFDIGYSYHAASLLICKPILQHIRLSHPLFSSWTLCRHWLTGRHAGNNKQTKWICCFRCSWLQVTVTVDRYCFTLRIRVNLKLCLRAWHSYVAEPESNTIFMLTLWDQVIWVYGLKFTNMERWWKMSKLNWLGMNGHPTWKTQVQRQPNGSNDTNTT